jgi:hypothetical protein
MERRSKSPPKSKPFLIDDLPGNVQADFQRFIKDMSVPLRLSSKIKNQIFDIIMNEKKEIVDENILDYFLAKDVKFLLELIYSHQTIHGRKKLEKYLKDKQDFITSRLDDMVEEELIDVDEGEELLENVYGPENYVSHWADEFDENQKAEEWVNEFKKEEVVEQPTMVQKVLNYFINPMEQKIIQEQFQKLTEQQKQFVNQVVLSSKSLLNLSAEEKRKVIAKFIFDLTKQGRNPSKY